MTSNLPFSVESNCNEVNSLADVKAGVDQTVHISPLTEIMYQVALEDAGEDDISADNDTTVVIRAYRIRMALK